MLRQRTARARGVTAGPARVAIRRRPADLALLVFGAAVLTLTALSIHADSVSVGETAAFRAVNGLPSVPFPVVWIPMQLGNFLIVPAAVLAALAVRRWRLAGGLAVAGTASYVLAKVVKHYVPRGRPGALLDDVVVRGAQASGIGYVSGHIATVTALTVVAWPWLPRWARWLATAAAAAVFFARLYVGAHLPLDMAGGAALGLAVGAAVRLLLGTPAATARGEPGPPRAEAA